MFYDAFLSYSHAADGKLAPALQGALHQFARRWYRRRALRVFRDKASLSANPALWPSIERALGELAYFLLLASPQAALSPWVRRETEWWTAHRPADRLLILVTDGEIRWDHAAGDFDWAVTTCLPPGLVGRFSEEPLYVDLRWARSEEQLSLRHSQFRSAVLDVAATLHGQPKDELDGEDVRQHARFRRAAWTALALLLALTIASGVSAFQAFRNLRLAEERRRQVEQANVLEQQARERESAARSDAERQRDDAQRQRAVAEEQRRLAEEQRRLAQEQRNLAEEQRHLADERRREAERQQRIALGRQLAAQSELLRGERGDMLPRSALLAVEASRHYPSLEADLALRAGLYLLPALAARIPSGGGSNSTVSFSPDGRYLLTTGYQSARLWAVPGGLEVAVPGGAVEAVQWSGDGRVLVVLRGRTLSALDAADLRPVASVTSEEPLTGFLLSPDGRFLCALTRSALIVWELPSARLLARIAQDPDGRTAFDPESRRLAVTGRGGAVFVANLGQGGEPLRIEPGGPPHYLAFSPNGRYLAINTPSSSGVWEADGGRRVLALTHPKVAPRWIWSPDSRSVAARSTLRTVGIHRLGSEGAAVELAHEGDINAYAFSPDGKYLATASFDQTARIWDVARGGEMQVLRHGSNVGCLAFSPDGRYLATGAYDMAARVWQVSTGREVRRMTHEPYVSTLAFSPDGRYLATGGAATSALLWSMERGGDAVSFRRERATDFALDAAGARMAIAEAGPERTVSIVDVASGRDWRTIQPGPSGSAVQLSLDGRYVAAGGRIWEAATGRELSGLPGQPAAFSADGTLAAMLEPDSSASVWDLAEGRRIAVLRHERRMQLVDAYTSPRQLATWGIARLVWSPSGERLATAGDDFDRGVRIWEPRTASAVASLSVGGARGVAIERMAFSPDGSALAMAASGLWLWRAGAVRELSAPGTSIFALAFSPDGRYLAAGVGADARVWDVSAGTEVAVLRHAGIVVSLVYGLAFASDGRHLASASRDGTARIWALPEGREVARMSVEKIPVQKVQFTRGDKYLATRSERGGVSLWLWQPEDLRAEACDRLLRNLTRDEWREYLGSEPYRKTCDNLP